MADGLHASWSHAGVGIRRSLELAHGALRAGGLPVGALVLDAHGGIVAEGRNRAYDPPGGPDRLQGTPIAHAEMNALAMLDTHATREALTVWSSHRPCAMCAAACTFTGIGAVRYVTPDPSDPVDHGEPDGGDHRWLVVANRLFLAGVWAYSGPSSPVIARAAEHEPEVSRLLHSLDLADLYGHSLPQTLAPSWTQIEAAATQRAARVG